MKTPNPLKWEENINKAKEILTVKFDGQMEVATLALEVCEITWGGNMKNGAPDERYTVKKFANEIGIAAKTLGNWIGVKKGIYDKLTQEKKMELSYSQCAMIGKMYGLNQTKGGVNNSADKFLQMDSFDFKMRKYIQSLKSISYNFSVRNARDKCEPETLEETKFYCRKILSKLSDVDSKDHGFANKINLKSISAARAVLGKRA